MQNISSSALPATPTFPTPTLSARWHNELFLFGATKGCDWGRTASRIIYEVRDGKLSEILEEGVVVSGIEAFSFLTEQPENSSCDPSLLALIESTKFLIELLCHGQTLPIAREIDEKGILRVSWDVAFSSDAFRHKFSQLAGSLPLSLTFPAPTPEAFLREFLQSGFTALASHFAKTCEQLKDALENEREPITRAFIEGLSGGPGKTVLERNLKAERAVQGFLTWGRSLRVTEGKPELALHLKLTEPKSVQGSWRLDYGLGVKLHPEKLALIEELRTGQTVLHRLGFSQLELEQRLLLELAKAERIFPLLKRCLQDNRLKLLQLSPEEAYEMLNLRAPDLIKSGVVVDLPPWYAEKRPKLSLTLKLGSSLGTSRETTLGLQSLVDFKWAVSLDEEELTQDEFDLLVKSQKPFVYLRGRWVEVSQDKLLNARKLLNKSEGQMRLVDALRTGANLDEENSLPVLRVEANGWLKPLLEGRGGVPRVEQPAGFLGELREYQRQGLDWLVFLSEFGIGGCLADDMGLGKTVQFLALLMWERERQSVPPTLLVVPMSILGNWKRECDRFAPGLRVLIHHGADRLSGVAFGKAVGETDLVLTTYALACRDEELIRSTLWHRVALDEAQSIKNLNTKQSRSIRKLIDEQLTLVGRERPVERLALTGTPLENHLEELYSIFDFLNPGYLGSLSEFRRKFAIPVERYRDRSRAEALATLIKPLMLRRLKSDPLVISDLPEKIEIDEYVALTKEQASLYQSVVEDLLPQVDLLKGIHRKGFILSVITRLKQICDDPALFMGEQTLRAGRSGKVERLKELLETILAEGDSTLIFTQYAKMGELLREHLATTFNQDVLFLHGSLSRPAREKLLKRFYEDEKPQIFILSLKAGGFGLNLTKANQVIHFDHWWNPAVENQATDRAHRIGQTRSVQVRRLINQGTLEERIMALSNSKRELAEQVVGSTREYLTEMGQEELKALLELSISSIREDPV